jgi:hypothetical protein
MNAKADAENNYSYVSTGRLPAEAEVISLIDEVYTRYKSNTDGRNSQVYPALAEVPSDLFGVCEARKERMAIVTSRQGTAFATTNNVAIAPARTDQRLRRPSGGLHDQARRCPVQH